MEVRKKYGCGHKESVYQNAYEEELSIKNIPYIREKSVKVYSPTTSKVMGSYRPDFLIDNKIIVETKAVKIIPKVDIDTFYNYLRNSKYELGFLINFGAEQLKIKRVIYTNDRKERVSV